MNNTLYIIIYRFTEKHFIYVHQTLLQKLHVFCYLVHSMWYSNFSHENEK